MQRATSAILLLTQLLVLSIEFVAGEVKLSCARARGAATAVPGTDLIIFASGTQAKKCPNNVDAIGVTNRAVNGSWTIMQRELLAAASVDGVVMVGGGEASIGGKRNVNEINVYNVATRRWTKKALHSDRKKLGAAALPGLIMFGGGYGKHGYKADLDVYNTVTKSWTVSKKSPALSVARQYVAAGAAGDILIFANGQSKKETQSTTVDMYHKSTNTWTRTNTHCARTQPVAVSLNGSILIGGMGSQRTFDLERRLCAVDIIDATNFSVIKSTFSMARASLAAASAGYGRFALFAGGESPTCQTEASPNQKCDDVDVWDSQDNSWFPAKPLFSPTSYLMGAGNGDVAVFAGGQTPAGMTDVVQFYDSKDLLRYKELFMKGGTSFRKDGEDALWWSGEQEGESAILR